MPKLNNLTCQKCGKHFQKEEMDALCRECLLEWWDFVRKPEYKWQRFEVVWNEFLKKCTFTFR